MTITATPIVSLDPATEEVHARFDPHTPEQATAAVAQSYAAFLDWRDRSFAERAALMRSVAALLRGRADGYARLITQEMGKPITQSRAEVEKCAWGADFYAENAARYLADEPIATDAARSLVAFEPIGPILAVMPWNFPFWQVLRFAAPALMAGNTALLKHASNVPRCALAIEETFRDAGFPEGAFRTLLLPAAAVEPVIADPRVRAVTLTGSSETGTRIARAAGEALKKTVLELGGSDPFIVLRDADIDRAARTAAEARLFNSGQSCICAKRFVVEEQIAPEFERRFAEALRTAKVGDPMDPATEVGPLARADLRDALDRQVRESVEMGARVVVGGHRIEGRGFFYEPTLLADCTDDMPVLREETFGPVAALVRARDADDAIRIANATPYGLAATVWTSDLALADRLARRIEAGTVFINGKVSSDPRMPFGGTKRSGYGRELGSFGIREFVNIQSIVVPASERPMPLK